MCWRAAQLKIKVGKLGYLLFSLEKLNLKNCGKTKTEQKLLGNGVFSVMQNMTRETVGIFRSFCIGRKSFFRFFKMVIFVDLSAAVVVKIL